MSEAKLYYHRPRSTGTIATPLAASITAAGIAYNDMLLPTYHGKRLDATPYKVRVGFAGLNADWVLTPTVPSDAVSVTPVAGDNACQVVLDTVPAGAQFVYLMINDIQAQVLPLPAFSPFLISFRQGSFYVSCFSYSLRDQGSRLEPP